MSLVRGIAVSFISFSVLLGVSCKQADSAKVESVSERHGGWAAGPINVCWAGGSNSGRLYQSVFWDINSAQPGEYEPGAMGLLPASPKDRELVKTAVVESYDLARTGVSFEKWDACPNVATAKELRSYGYEVAIFYGDAEKMVVDSSASGIGRTKDPTLIQDGTFAHLRNDNLQVMGVVFTFSLFCSGTRISPDKCKEAIAAHEFGHLLGLQHEDFHPDAAKDPMCTQKSGGLLRMSSTNYGPYDPASIMNQCHKEAFFQGDPNSAIKTPRASDGDRAAIKALLISK